MGCMCVNPFAARNMFRYHMRIKGEDALEMIVPTACIAVDQFIMLPPNGFINFYMLGAMFATMQLLAEVEARGNENIVAKRYLTGYRVDGDEDDHEHVHYEDAMGRSLTATATASAPLQEVELMVPKRGEVIVPSAILSESAAVRVTEPKR
jgi:hypothetical protein